MIPVLNLVNSAAAFLLANFLNSLIFAAGFGFAAWLLLSFARGLNAATRHVILWTVLLAIVAIPILSLAPESSIPEPPAPIQTIEPAAADPAPVQIASAAPEPGSLAAGEEVVDPEPRFPFQLRAGYLPLALAIVWMVFCIAQLARIAWSYLYLSRLKRESVPANRDLRLSFDEWKLACGIDRDVRLLISDTVSSPLAAGFRHAAVILPRGMMEKLPAKDQDHVVLHELAHLARRDDWTNLIARLAAALIGLHPVAAWILRRIDAERELACDDWVVDMTGAAKSYAASLARLVEFRLSRRREVLATGIGGRRSELAARIERLVRAGGRFDSRTSFLRVMLTAAALCLGVIAAVQGPEWIVFAQEEYVPAPPVPAFAPAAPVAPTALRPGKAPRPAIAAVPPASPVMWAPPAPPAPAIADAAEFPTPFEFAYAAPPPAPPQAKRDAPPPPPPPPAARSNSSGTSFLASLTDAGYGNLSVEEVIELKNHGVDGAYIAAMNKAGWGKLTPKQLIDLRNHGVRAEYLQGLASSGLKNLTLTDVRDLKNHGVRPEFVKELNALGMGPFTVRQIIDFANHGGRPELFRALKEAGFGEADPKEIIEAMNHGLRAHDLREAKKYGASLTLRQIIRLKEAGVI